MPEEQRIMASIEADRRLTTVETILRLHVEQCDRRANLAQKLMWVAVGTNLAVLGTLLSKVLHWG